MHKNKIIASHWAVAGNRTVGDGIEASEFDFRERMEVCGKIGFQGAGFVELDLLETKKKYGYAEAKKIAHANGITELEVEMVYDWVDPTNYHAIATRKNVLEAAEQLNARHIKIGGVDADVPMEVIVEEFVKLCKQAEDIGTKIAIEMMPFHKHTNTIKKVLELLRTAGMKNAGFCLDSWHTFRGNVDYNDILLIKPEEIVTVEIDDGGPEIVGDLWNDTLNYRYPAGEGVFDVKDFMQKLLSTGYDGTIGCEIIAADHRQLPLRRAAARAYASVKQYL